MQRVAFVVIQNEATNPIPVCMFRAERQMAYNRHSAVVLARFPAASLSLPCRIGRGEAVSFAALAEDCVRHLDHHLAQLARPVVPDAEPRGQRVPPVGQDSKS
jgi:hypothetical protein